MLNRGIKSLYFPVYKAEKNLGHIGKNYFLSPYFELLKNKL